jgi:YVTN family beta-propeller protein
MLIEAGKLAAIYPFSPIRIRRLAPVYSLEMSNFFSLPGIAGAVLALAAAGPVQAAVVVVLNSGDASVSLIDPATLKEIRRFEVGKEPHHLMATPDGQTLIVANAAGNDLVYLDPTSGELQRRVRNIPDPYQIGFSPDRKWFVVAGNRLNRVDVYSATGADLKLARAIPAAKTPSHIAFSADSQLAFVTLQDSNEVVAIRLADQTPLWKVKTGEMPAGIWMTPDDRHLLVGITGADYVEVFDWRSRAAVKRIPTGKGAHNFRPLGDGRHLFVTNRVENTVSLIDQTTLERKYDIRVPGGPDCMELTADGKHLWVTQRWIKQVAVVDVTERKVVASIPVGRSPHGIFLANGAAWK